MSRHRSGDALASDRALMGAIACIVAPCVRAKPPKQFVWPASVFQETRGNAAESAARLIACYVAKTEFGLTQTRIGDAIGRDRSTVGHAIEVVRRWAAEEESELDGAELWLAEVRGLCRRAWTIGQAHVDFEADLEAR